MTYFAECCPWTCRATDCESAEICGSLFLAGEALVALGAYPYSADRFDPSEQLRQTTVGDGR